MAGDLLFTGDQTATRDTKMAKKQITPADISERDLAIDALGVLSAQIVSLTWISAISANSLRRHRGRRGLLQVEGLATHPPDLAITSAHRR